MRPILLLMAFTLIINVTHAQKQENYSRAKIYLDANGHTMRDLAASGVAVDHGEYKKNTWFVSDFSQHEIDMAKQAGFKVDILIPDVVKHYQDQNKKKAESAQKTTSISCNSPAITDPAHFHLGSYAGFFTYTEMLAILDSMHTLYPTLISTRQPIGTFNSIEGRPIYWIRISNNPAVDQPAKPQILYTALHHAREPGTISSTIYYLWYLLENYSTDPEIKAIIDNAELYFVPCVNPDGYIYNITTNPLGGGMWRKNRRDNLDGTFGIDLNRNYGYKWGYDNIGSSPMSSSDVYRGPAAFSEPETQAVKWFVENHHFKVTLNYHTYGNDIIYPWGYLPSLQTVDSEQFFNYAQFFTRYDHYAYGTGDQTVGYVTNGDSDDWLYGDTVTKAKVFGFTPEIGTSLNGFYPPATQILPDCRNNLHRNINAAALLIPFANIQHTDKKILTQPSGYLHYSLQRYGFPDTATFTATIVPLDSWMTVSPTPKVYTGLSMLQLVNDSISYTIASATPNGQLVSYVLQLYNGLYYMRDTVHFYYGKEYAVYTPQTVSLTDWVNAGWGVCTTAYYIPTASIQSSITGESNYADAEDITINESATIDLTHAIKAYLQFYTKWAIEQNYDQVTANASVVGSGTSQPLCGMFTRPQQTSGLPVYDGHQPNWVREEMDLGDYLGQKINIQFELVSDLAVNDKGFYFDDVSITALLDTPQSVHQVSATPSIAIYPNPAQDQLTLAVSGYTFSQPLNAVLYDCVGREAMHLTSSAPITHIDVRQLPAGLYYLRVFDSGQPLPVQKINIMR